jgi:hypothetical protein
LGHEYIFRDFLRPNQTQLYFFNNTSSGTGLANLYIDQSLPGNFVAIIDKANTRLWLTQITSTAGTPYNTFSSAYTYNYGMAPNIKSMGFQDEVYLYVHTTGWCIFAIDLASPLTMTCPVSLPPSHLSTHLIFDSVSQSVMLINDQSTTLRTITQFKVGTSYNYQYNITSTNFLLGNSKTFYLGNVENLIQFMSYSCIGTYNSATLGCTGTAPA